MVSVGVLVLGVTGLHFANPVVKTNGKYYRETLLKELEVRHFRILYLLARQRASSSWEGNSWFLSTETPAFILPTLWPPNSPDLNPVDYKVWSVLQEQAYKVKVNNVDELRQRIQTVCYELDQCIIDKAIKQWRTHLRAWVEAKGGHFEQKL